MGVTVTFGTVTSAGKLDQRSDGLVPTGFQCQQPQKQHEEYAAYTHPSMNDLSYSAVTQSKKLLRHPVVEQLAMIGTRLAIPGPSEVNE